MLASLILYRNYLKNRKDSCFIYTNSDSIYVHPTRNRGGIMKHLRKPEVMILGTFHMIHTPDLYRVDASDLLEPRRQDDIRKVIERI